MRVSVARRFGPIIFSFVITSVCLFGSSGRLDWPNAWVLLGLNFAVGVATMVLLWGQTELLAERSNARAGKSWDKAIVGVAVFLGPAATWITAGLDSRFHWPDGVPSWAFFAGVIIAVLAAAVIAWAMRSNQFFSSIVRIQKDRGHVVVARGPYRFVRHPGYAGMSAFTLATPFILDSWWACAPAAVTAATFVLRTILEDRTLHNELDGYADYAFKVKYKLLPALW
jgi:protein-S-isoprenylcysteine O-methyltransferase Ste14